MDKIKLETQQFEILTTKRKREEGQQPPESLFKNIRFEHKEKEDASLKSLVTQATVCGVAVLALLAVTVFDKPLAENHTQNSDAVAVASEEQNPEDDTMDIGRLKFVDAAMPVMSGEVVMPVMGEIVSLYDGDKRLGITLSVATKSDVKSATTGVVIETTPVLVRVGMDDGRILSYKGVIPSVEVGDCLNPGDVLGKSTAGEVTISLIENDKAVDPLNLLSNIR